MYRWWVIENVCNYVTFLQWVKYLNNVRMIILNYLLFEYGYKIIWRNFIFCYDWKCELCPNKFKEKSLHLSFSKQGKCTNEEHPGQNPVSLDTLMGSSNLKVQMWHLSSIVAFGSAAMTALRRMSWSDMGGRAIFFLFLLPTGLLLFLGLDCSEVDVLDLFDCSWPDSSAFLFNDSEEGALFFTLKEGDPCLPFVFGLPGARLQTPKFIGLKLHNVSVWRIWSSFRSPLLRDGCILVPEPLIKN